MVRIGGKGMSYIVKNCPCIKHFDEVELDNRCMSTQDNKLFFCENNTDCVIKQVIEKCKDAVSNYSNLEILRTACETSEAYGKANIAEQILQLFDIEEINK